MSLVPECPSAWRKGVDKDQQYADKDHAQSPVQGGVNNYRALATLKLRELLSSAEVRMRMWEGDLEGWLGDGVFKTVHGGGNTSGHPNLDLRIEVEAKVLGVPDTATEFHRPRYGYAQGSAEAYTEINLYGKILVRFRDHVRDHTTVMLGDSMGSTNSGGWPCMAPEPLCAPQLPCRYSECDIVNADALGDACDPAYRYAELQIYGPLGPEDITEVVFCDGVRATRGLRNLLGDWSVTFYELDDYPT